MPSTALHGTTENNNIRQQMFVRMTRMQAPESVQADQSPQAEVPAPFNESATQTIFSAMHFAIRGASLQQDYYDLVNNAWVEL